MTSMVNFEEKLKERRSDAILNYLNRINESKKSGVIVDDELGKILILEGSLFANKIKEGKIDEDNISSFLSFVNGIENIPFTVDYNLKGVSERINEDIDLAKYDEMVREQQSAPVKTKKDYNNSFRRLS